MGKTEKRWLAMVLCAALAVGGVAWQLVPAVAESECTCEIEVHGSNCPLSRCSCDGADTGEHTEDCALYGLNSDMTVCVCQPNIHAEGCPRYEGAGELLASAADGNDADQETEETGSAEQETQAEETEPVSEESPDTEITGEDLTETDPVQDGDAESSPETDVPGEMEAEEIVTDAEGPSDTDGEYSSGWSGYGDSRSNAQVAAQAFELDAQLEEHVATVQGYLTNGHNARLSEDEDNFGDILAVYAVLSGQTEDYPYGISLEEEDVELLHSVYWSMTQVTGLSNAGGAAISVRRLSAAEGAELYNLTAEQKTEVLSLAAQSDLVDAIVGENAVVTVALSQVGNVGGETYWNWYGFSSRVEWCATFVSWVADQCGYIEAGVIPKFAGCSSQGVPWFQERGLWQAGSYTPSPGDIIFFDWDGDLSADHVGIVEKVENGRVYTIEGNCNDDVSQSSYPIGYSSVLGYGTPAY